MPRRLAALLLDLLLLQLLLVGGSADCLARAHASHASPVVVERAQGSGTVAPDARDPHALHVAHAAHAGHSVPAGDDGAADAAPDAAPDGAPHCVMATACAGVPLASRTAALYGTALVHERAAAPVMTRPASTAFAPEPPPPRA